MNKAYYQKLVEKERIGTITAAETEELQQWINNDPSLSKWWEKEYIESNQNISSALSEKLFEQIKAQVKIDEPVITISHISHTKIKRIAFKALPWVAAIVLPIVLFLSLYGWLENPQQGAMPMVLSVEKGERATIELTDGSRVQLNSDSRLSYVHPMRKGERRATLVGEGYFQVAHDERNPFVIEVGELVIRVLGTSFTVTSYEELEEVSVVLLEGKVEVNSAYSSCTLLPGERLRYNKSTQAMLAEEVDASDYLAWTKGELYFDNESMENIVKTLSRMYDLEIYISSNSLCHHRFTGTIPTVSIEKTLRILMLTAPFFYSWENGNIVLKER